MLTRIEAADRVALIIPGIEVQACVAYKGHFLVRVEHVDSPDEANFDPFFIVNSETGGVQEFNPMTDGEPLEIHAAFEEAGEIID